MKNCLLTPITSILALAAASSFGAAYDYNFTTTLPTNVDWFDVGWEAKETTESRDRYYVNIINADAANIYIDKGMNADIADSACMYTQGDTRIVIGNPDDTKTTEMHFIHTGGDSFLEVTGRSSIVVRQNGILTLDANRSLRNWSISNELPSDFIHVLVDGGTFNGNIYTQAPANAGFFNIVFRNGGTLNRSTEVNPLKLNGKSTMTFDNATYNVWSATNTTNNGWGNHVMNEDTDNQDYRIAVTLKNGAVWNGAGDVEGGAVTYWDFSEDITSAYNSNQKSADLTLQVGRATSEDSYFTFQILDGAKLSAKNIILGSTDGTRGKHAMGTFTFEMQGASGNVSMLASSGGTTMALARGINESSFTNNFLLKGYAKYQTAGGFSLGYNEIAGGTANFILSGESNIFQIGGNLNVNAGWNSTEETPSTAAINISMADAANSTFQTNGMNIYSAGDSQIDVRFLGKTNTVNFTNGDFNMYSSKISGNSASTVEIGTAEFTSSRNFRLTNNMQGDQKLIFSNGVQATVNSASFTASNYADGTAKSYYIIKDGASLTTNNDNGYSSPSGGIVSGEVGFLLEGDGSSFISKGQMNIHPGNNGNTGGVYAIRLHGTNGLFEAQKNLHFTGLFQGDDAMYLLEMLGSGNTANINTFNFGNGNSTAGTYRFYSKSDSAENKNTLKLTNTTISMEGQMVANSTAKREYILAGNTVLRSNSGGALVLKVHEYAGRVFLGGDALFEIRGSGNDVLFSDMLFGNGVATGGTATLRIAGGGSHIECANFRMARGAETSWENPIGGILEFLFDDTGITSIQANNGINGSLNGLIKIDFTGMQGNYQDERFVLMTVNQSNLESLISQYWYDFISQEALDNLRLITRGLEDEKIEFAVEDSTIIDGYKDFVVYYTGTSVIPEPSTFAAIFGALAIAFALYRRRR